MIGLKSITVTLFLSFAVVGFANGTPVADNQATIVKTLKEYDTKYNNTEIMKLCAIEKNLTIAEAERDFNSENTGETKCVAGCVYKKMNMIVNGKYSLEELKNVIKEGDDEKLFYEKFFEICPQRGEITTDECLLGNLLTFCVQDVHRSRKLVLRKPLKSVDE